MPHFVYILSNPKEEYYPGMTENIELRLIRHNTNQVMTTKNRGPWKILIIEECLERKSARIRERYWKSSAGRRRRKNILESENEFPYYFTG